jgi:protein kinase-like protein
MNETLQDGRFVLTGLLGEGSQGRTFDAIDRHDGRRVAVKRFDVRGASRWKDAELAEREARVLQSLSHPKLPRYIDHFEEQGSLYLVMEKVEGETLASLRARGRTLAPAEIFRFLDDAADVLDYLHRRPVPVIHRDLKPGNVLRRSDGSFAFVDFGAVRDKLRPEGGSTIVGTFGYMAPEQFQGRALPASDVYAVGATALSLLTGREPETLPHRGLAIDVRASVEPSVDRALAGLLERMLEPDPDRRPARLRALLDELRAGSGDRRYPFDGRSPGYRGVTEHIERRVREYERRVIEFTRQAADGGDGAERWHRKAEKWRKGEEKWRAALARHLGAFATQADRRTLRRERRAVRRAARRRHGRLPWPVALLVGIGLTVAIVTVFVATQVLVPLVLLVLSRISSSAGLSRAAVSVRKGGRTARANMAAARRSLMRGEHGADDTLAGSGQEDDPAAVGRVRVNPVPSPESEGDAREPADDSDAVEAAASDLARTKS